MYSASSTLQQWRNICDNAFTYCYILILLLLLLLLLISIEYSSRSVRNIIKIQHAPTLKPALKEVVIIIIK